jgi:hypothetical protein
MNSVRVAAFVIVTGLAAPVAAQLGTASSPASPLSTAKDLYASARYDEALSVLNGLRVGGTVDKKSVEQYRSLCLLALGRASEAESAIAAVVTADPMYRPGESDASPRVRSTFTDVRRRLLPEIAKERYAAAKALFDRQAWAAAEQHFRTVLALIDDPDTGGRLTDSRVLTVGFLELSARAAGPPPAAAPKSAPLAPAPVTAAPPASVVAAPVSGRIYNVDDPGVTPPTTVRQDIPAVPASVIPMARPRGLLEVIVDEHGRVVTMTIRASIHPAYDTLLLTSARDWKYRPATVNGQPVKFRKLIQVSLKK